MTKSRTPRPTQFSKESAKVTKDSDICDSEIPALRIAKFGHARSSLVRDKNRRDFIFVDQPKSRISAQ